MDLLSTAVVDITTLAATCHALARRPDEEGAAVPPKLRRRLRREIKRGTVAYIDTLARARRSAPDDALLVACRIAAEQAMALALEHQALLREILLGEAGSLDGLAATRQDLWRLAHLAIHLRLGVAAMHGGRSAVHTKALDKLAGRLRRRLRKALIAYARATLRRKPPHGQRVVSARRAALAEIGQGGATLAERLADLESHDAVGREAGQAQLRLGVCRPLLDLALDWQAAAPTDAVVSLSHAPATFPLQSPGLSG
jgi:hypothetical protein